MSVKRSFVKRMQMVMLCILTEDAFVPFILVCFRDPARTQPASGDERRHRWWWRRLRRYESRDGVAGGWRGTRYASGVVDGYESPSSTQEEGQG